MPNVLPYLIEASDLEQAEDDPSFALRFPRLIEQLVRASLQVPPTAIRFPSFDTGQVHGFDGSLDSAGAPPYVPAGRCIFEFKTSSSPRPDAQADYDKRKAQIPAADAASMTFVFVTSHSWPGQGQDITQWEDIKRQEQHFKDVKIFDATAVVAWLHMHPAVALYGSRHILRVLPRDFDAQDINDFPATYEGSFEFPLPPTVLLAGRSELAASFRESGIPVGITNLLADEEDEAASFICRALLSTTDDETRSQRLATSLVISDLSSARSLDGTSGLNLILTGSAKQAATRLSRSNSVVACRVFGEIAAGDAKNLDIPNLEEFAEALSSGGEIDRDRARDLGVKNGRSLTILRRHHGSGTDVPIWAAPEAAVKSEVRAAALCGAWSETHASDKQVVQLLSSGTYSDVTRQLRAYTGRRDSLLVELDRIWALRAPVDAFSLLSPFIGSDDLQRFSDAIKLVFEAQKDSVADPDEVFDPSKQVGHSARLKTGLAQNVLLISALGDVLGIHPEVGDCRQFAAGIVNSIPNLGAHPGFLAAFSRELPYLAEAAPNAFLDALEPLLEGSEDSLKWFLTPYEGKYSLFPSSYVHALIWALQLIAWLPEHFERVCRTLARLAIADLSIESQGEPRPLYALKSIFTSWAPQTAASLEQRTTVLRKIARDFPEIAAKLLFQLLPDSGVSVDSHSRPRFADVPEKAITYGDIWSFDYAVVQELARLRSTDAGWLSEIITHLSDMRDDAFGIAVAAIGDVVTHAASDARTQIWKILRREIAKHQQFRDADWAMPESRIEVLTALGERATPSPTEASTFLFDEDMPDLGIQGWEENEAEIKRRRQSAVARFVTEGKPGDLVAFAQAVTHPQYISGALLDLKVTIDFLEQLIVSAADNRILVEQFSRVAYALHGDHWLDRIIDETNLEESRRRTAFGALIADNRLVERLERLSPELFEFYWTNSPTRVWDLNGTAFETAITNWSRVGRDLEVIEQISLKEKEITSTLLLQILSKSIQTVLSSKEHAKRFNSYIFERILTELDGRPDVALVDIVKLEWPLIPVLYLGHRRKLAIHKLMATSPSDFLEIIGFAYRPRGSKSIELSEGQRNLADNAGKVLITFNYSPYLDTPIEATKLASWIDNSLELADQSGYGDITRIYIGHVLAHAPADEQDGHWPDKLIRGLIEQYRDDKIESGISTERFNMRGVHSDSVEFYRKHSEEGRVAADAMGEWPIVQNLLIRIADGDQRWSESALRDRKKDELDNSL